MNTQPRFPRVKHEVTGLDVFKYPSLLLKSRTHILDKIKGRELWGPISKTNSTLIISEDKPELKKVSGGDK